MNPSTIIDQTKTKLQVRVEHFQSNLKSLRTGRTSASMLDGVTVGAYVVRRFARMALGEVS